MDLLTEEQLIWSSIVANNSMNRKRSASGVNSYEYELGFKPETYLDARLEQQECVKWLDLCCGEGNALLQYADAVLKKGRQDRSVLLGIDLVDYFQPLPQEISCLKFQTGSLVNWTGNDQYDLVTCVHGLHYIGDKLKVLAAALKVISSSGKLVANFDINSVKIEGDKKQDYLKKIFRKYHIGYDARRKLLHCEGTRDVSFHLVYKGADDKAGPNYTGQDAVNSYYIQQIC